MPALSIINTSYRELTGSKALLINQAVVLILSIKKKKERKKRNEKIRCRFPNFRNDFKRSKKIFLLHEYKTKQITKYNRE